MSFDLFGILSEYVRDRQRGKFDDRASTCGAADVGQCARKVYCTKNDGDPDYGVEPNPGFEESWGATFRGTLIEDHLLVPALRKRFRSEFQRAGRQQQTLVSGFLSATPDGLFPKMPHDCLAHLGVDDIGGDSSLLVEFKSIDPRVELTAPKPPHTYQCQVGLGLVHELTPHRPEHCLIVYVDASFLDTIREFPIKRDPDILEAAKTRARMIMTARLMSELKPEG
jgi:hypothetical protein